METLDQLLYWRGIASDYFNYKGENITVSLENRKALMHAMGVDPNSAQEVALESYRLDVLPWTLWIPSFQVVEQHKESCFFFNVGPDRLEAVFSFKIILESGESISGNFVPTKQPEVGDYMHQGVRYSKRVVMCGALPLGYHSLVVESNGEQCIGHMAVVPEKAYLPEGFNDAKKTWGFIVQLYTLRSERNWGIGDLSDLKFLVKKAAQFGVGILGLNPLHVLCTPNEHHYSPYSPSDRRYIEPLYIDPECVHDFSFVVPPSLTELASLREPSSVNYSGVFQLKFRIFKAMFGEFKSRELKNNTQRAQSFFRYMNREGSPLTEYCTYQVLRNHGIHTYSSISVALTCEQQDESDFYAYLQWIAQEQIESCQILSEELGMCIGLMRDLAVGADGCGSEVTTNANLFCKLAAVGAPPDPLAEKGQNWGLPPMDPAELRQTSFKHFINLLRSNMSHCGALRIDHAMGLMRLWWCPPGKTADFGAYVYYPFPEMLGLLKLESIRNKCMVIGEDMGVVPNEFREAIISGSVFTNKLFYFERECDGSFKLPANYMPRALAMLTNHDVPTLTSWWAATDLKLRSELQLLDESVPMETICAERLVDKHRLLDWLVVNGFCLDQDRDLLISSPLSQDLLAAVMTCGAKVASQIYVLQLDDIALIDAPVNVPGTSTQYANWQRKLSVNLEDIFADIKTIDMLKNISKIRN